MLTLIKTKVSSEKSGCANSTLQNTKNDNPEWLHWLALNLAKKDSYGATAKRHITSRRADNMGDSLNQEVARIC